MESSSIFKVESKRNMVFVHAFWIFGLVYTAYQVGTNISNFLAYNSTIAERDVVGARTPPFPNIILCSDSIHSWYKEIGYLFEY